MAQPPIQFDRATGVLEGANAWERLAALALASGSKVAKQSVWSTCPRNLLSVTPTLE